MRVCVCVCVTPNHFKEAIACAIIHHIYSSVCTAAMFFVVLCVCGCVWVYL